jgi:hypothetical protein
MLKFISDISSFINKLNPSVVIKSIFFTGIRSLKTISPNSTLTELGIDSLTVVEVKQLLE